MLFHDLNDSEIEEGAYNFENESAKFTYLFKKIIEDT